MDSQTAQLTFWTNCHHITEICLMKDGTVYNIKLIEALTNAAGQSLIPDSDSALSRLEGKEFLICIPIVRRTID